MFEGLIPGDLLSLRPDMNPPVTVPRLEKAGDSYLRGEALYESEYTIEFNFSNGTRFVDTFFSEGIGFGVWSKPDIWLKEGYVLNSSNLGVSSLITSIEFCGSIGIGIIIWGCVISAISFNKMFGDLLFWSFLFKGDSKSYFWDLYLSLEPYETLNSS